MRIGIAIGITVTGALAGPRFTQVGTCFDMVRDFSQPRAVVVGNQTDYFCFEVTP